MATVTAPASAAPATADEAIRVVTQARQRRGRRWSLIVGGLAIAVIAAWSVTLMFGQHFYPPSEVLAVIAGQDVPGASFTVGRLRLPRASMAVVAGMSFGLAGVTFQTMLRNPLASPDIIGISSGASAAAAFAIVMLNLRGTPVSVIAVAAGLVVAAVVHLLSWRHGVASARLILIGIGIAAMLNSVTTYVLQKASQWEIQEAMRWLAGSLNGTRWAEVLPVLLALVLLGPTVVTQSRNLASTQLGDDAASALGVRVEVTRIVCIVAAVGLISFATAATGPIAFVAFLAGPIAGRILGPNGSPLLPAALVGALLVLVADFIGQFLAGTRFPVGVVTGVLGAPYLLYLIIRHNRTGGGL